MEQTQQDLQDVLFNIAQAEAFSDGWHKNIAQWRNLYNFQHYEQGPLPGETQFADPTFTNTVDLGVAIILANPLTWRATPWKPTNHANKLSSELEKFLIGTIEANTDRNEYDLSYEILLHFVRDGGAVVYHWWDEDIAAYSRASETVLDVEGTPVNATVYEECPMRLQVIDPMSIRLLPGGRGRWMAIMRAEQQNLYDIKMRFGLLPPAYQHLSDLETMLSTKGTLIDYWDVILKPEELGSKKVPVVRNAVLFDKEFIPGWELKPMPQYKSMPYTIGFYKPTDRLNSKMWDGILKPLVGSVRQLETSINRRQRQIDMFSSMPFVSKTLQGRDVSVDPGMGKVVSLSVEEDFGFPIWQGNPPDVERQIDFLRSRVQQSGFSDVFYGAGASQVSGYALSQLGDQNRIRLEQPVTHLERFYGWMARKIVEITTNNAGENAHVRVYGKMRGVPFAGSVSVVDLNGLQISCEIIPEFPNEKVRNHAMATQVRGLLSDRRIMEHYLGVQQPDDEFDVRMIEQAQKNPILTNYALISKLTEMADAGDKVAEMTLLALQQSGIPGMPGRPEEETNPQQNQGVPQGGQPAGGTIGGTEQALASTSPTMIGGINGNEG